MRQAQVLVHAGWKGCQVSSRDREYVRECAVMLRKMAEAVERDLDYFDKDQLAKVKLLFEALQHASAEAAIEAGIYGPDDFKVARGGWN